MIKAVTIDNFQSHKHTELKFTPGVNVIIGKSDSGKTAIIRSLIFAMKNKPSGNEFCSNWGGETKVKINTETDTISRIKGKSNEYLLNDTSFKAFGTDVPEEIKNALNVNDINIQQQLDTPFLLTQSPGKIAEHFNKIAHLNQIDTSLQFIQNNIRKLNREIEYDKKKKIEIKEELESYSYLPKLEAEIEVLEIIENEKLQRIKKIKELENIIFEIKTNEKQLIELKEDIKYEQLINDTLIQIKEKKEIENNITQLKNTINQIQKLNKDIKEYQLIINSEQLVNGTLIQLQERKKMMKEIKELKNLLYNITDIWRQLKIHKKQHKELNDKFILNFPDICPLCGANKVNQKL